MKKEDLIYYIAWLTVFILFGAWIIVAAVGLFPPVESILLWLVCVGMVMMVAGTVKTRRKPGGDSTSLFGGMLLTIVMLIVLAFKTDAVEGWAAAGLAVVLIGIAGLMMFIARIKGQVED